MVTFLFQHGDWQHEHWNPRESRVIPMSPTGACVLDDSIQSVVATGDTAKECQAWIDDENQVARDGVADECPE